MSDMTSTEKRRRLILFSLLGISLAVSILLASFFLFSPEKPSATASLTSARTEAISGRAGGEGSAEYNQKLKEHDARQADNALKAGESFVPTPVGQKKSVVGKKEDTPPAPPPVAPVRTTPPQTLRTDNTMLKRMMDDLAALDTKLSAFAAGEGKIVYLRDFSDATTPVAATAEKAVAAEKPVGYETHGGRDADGRAEHRGDPPPVRLNAQFRSAFSLGFLHKLPPRYNGGR